MGRQIMTLTEIREKDLEALSQHLGAVGMVRFLQQSELGWGNYTEERDQWLGDPDLDEVAQKIQVQFSSPDNAT
ncbi:MAG: hypothetical protein ETSY1_25630 [Candidatus Entotheonella factor]|uniref:Uncharacterized protein n=1 Tax=Entotheonella factor TaxID=1429438 RepID=W4LF79_ENTF1|nr:hypothetical protein [Candidatus Entotheonella palauensis]ETW96662.1 MAG: hypothetical protein ETSY1_25630 [Candidatus Entotheonella factor]